jgi:hypothetical protein
VALPDIALAERASVVPKAASEAIGRRMGYPLQAACSRRRGQVFRCAVSWAPWD